LIAARVLQVWHDVAAKGAGLLIDLGREQRAGQLLLGRQVGLQLRNRQLLLLLLLLL
jgi:hypothetical protein